MLFRCHCVEITCFSVKHCSMLVQIFRNFLSDNPVSHEIKRAAAVVKATYENGLHTVLPVFYKASSILANHPSYVMFGGKFSGGNPWTPLKMLAPSALVGQTDVRPPKIYKPVRL